MRFGRSVLLLMAAMAAQAATTWDNSGNSMLNGEYYFRQVYYFPNLNYGEDLSRAIALYGMIKFDGNGNYSITAAEQAAYLDTYVGYEPVPLFATGTYSIAASGYGFITSPYIAGDVVYGLVSANGVFVGSSTENIYGYNDMLVAAPKPTQTPSFTGSWLCAGMDLTSLGYPYGNGAPAYALSYMFPLSPNGSSAGSGTVTGYVGGSSTAYTQSLSGLPLLFSNYAAKVTFPANGSLVAGNKYFYFSPDSSFFFGGDPLAFDMIVGVKTGTAAPSFSGLYYQAGIDETLYNCSGYVCGELDTYYGSADVIAGAAAQPILGHQRVNDLLAPNTYDWAYSDSISLQSNGTYSSAFARYATNASGTVQITSGIGASLGLSVAVKAPNPTGTGVYLSPVGVVNAANSAPFTADIAPGEFLTLYGTNLAPAVATAPGVPFPASLGSVQVSIGGLPAAVYDVRPSQVSAIVPYGVAGSACPSTGGRNCVQIQVTNNGVPSNVVTAYVGTGASGVFTQTPGGLGYGDIEHLDGSVVTAANPAQMGETLALYLTGLGAVSPTIADGAPGPSGTLSQATNTITVYFNVNGVPMPVTPLFAGLAPGFSGLYQLNVTLPTTGLTAGGNDLGIMVAQTDSSGTVTAPYSYMDYTLIPIAAAGTSTAAIAETGATPALAKPPVRRPGTGKWRTAVSRLP